MADSVRTKLALLGVGTFVGITLGLMTAKTVSYLRARNVPDGASFESVEDLRRAMLARDDRDVKGVGESVNLRAIIQPDPSDSIIYRLKPNLDVKFEGVPIRTNQFGLRGPETSVEKPPGTYRLALLGDSFAFGWGVEVESIFATVIGKKLEEDLNGAAKVEVLNFGVPGYSTFQEESLFEQTGLQFKPDAVLVYFIENDFGLPFFIKNFNGAGNLVNNRHFHTLKDKAEDTEAELGHNRLLKNLNSNHSLERLAKLCKEHGIDLFVVINPGKGWEKTEKRLWAVRRVPDITFLPVREDTERLIEERGLANERLTLPRDPHPNAVKHGILGEVMASNLLPFVKKKIGLHE